MLIRFLFTYKIIVKEYTSSAVLVTASKPTYEKKTVADPASTPFAPNGKYLKKTQ